MRRLGLGSWGFVFVWLAGGCGTDAVGVSECRAVEQARCSAAVSCGYPDVAECRRFYRDDCLHGVGLESVEAVDVQACVAQIERAGRCATDQPEAAPGACAEPIATVEPVSTVCDVILRPESASACAFLRTEPPAAPVPDAGGS